MKVWKDEEKPLRIVGNKTVANAIKNCKHQMRTENVR